ncbi:MAG: 4'-phosphopantetheinyl transferase superfamily protein [Capnocytophaga sp.]|nr:4'-phosphopantetheinyl transferase superfamily protein [Capnocytophaga sp.]
MPLIDNIRIDNNTQLLIWKVTEALEELIAGVSLNEEQKEKYDSIKLESNKKNFLVTRQILKGLNYQTDDLSYDESGKPVLKNGKSISISHSFDMVAVIISSSAKVGVDIEKKRDKILRVSEKFTQWDYRNTSLSNHSIMQKLTMIWSAKEAAYKAYGKPEITANHIFVKDFFPNDTNTNVKVSHNNKHTFYKINFMQFKEFVLAYCML